MSQYAQGSAFGRFMVTNQKYLYFPILCVARISWLMQSFLHAFEGLQRIGVGARGLAACDGAVLYGGQVFINVRT